MKSFIHLFLPFLFLMGLSFSSFGAIATPSTIAKKKAKKESAFKQISTEEIFTMPKKDIEAKIGRKLKVKEKLALLIVRKAVKKAKKKQRKAAGNENLLGILSLSFGAASLFSMLLFFGGSGGGGVIFGFFGGILFGIAGLTLGIISLKKGEPKNGLSIAGIILGATSIFIALLAILIIIIWLGGGW